MNNIKKLIFQLLKGLLSLIKSFNRGVAQSGSASGLGPEGRRFKSCRPDHLKLIKSILI